MKKYYLHNGETQQGPFDTNELRSMNIQKDTPIWYEGIDDWIVANKIEELKPLFVTSPPPFKSANFSEPIKKKEPIIEENTEKKSNFKKYAFIFIGCVILFFVLASIINSDSGYKSTEETYQEKVMTVAEIESSQPANFLEADGKYNHNFWGTKVKINGTIANRATVVTFKDAVVRVTYYTKTKTSINTEDYTIYETFPPNTITDFQLKINNYENVNSIGWEVVSAVAN